MQFDNTLTINAPISEVFAYLARPENLPRWNYALDRTEQTSPLPS
ncbi:MULTISPECIES: SRPBCC family protein [unclassified Kitasatospora]